MKKKILVIVAHPDDETLGCGGTILKLIRDGYSADVMFLTDGVSSRENKDIFIKKFAISRKHNALKACNVLGFKKVKFYDFPDNSLDTVAQLEISKVIELEIKKSKPDLIFTHNSEDLNIDHRIVAESTIIATRFYNKQHTIVSYEILSSTDLNFHMNNSNFKPNFFVDIKKTIKNKIRAFKEYKKEIRRFPHPRSEKGIQVLSNYRGMFSGLNNAEAFKIIKKIN